MLRAIIVFALFASICAHAPRASRSRNKTNGTTTTEDTNAADPVRDTPAGRVLGSWMQTRAGRRFESYRGIRYAEPPTGELRFKPPVDITSYQDDADGRNEGPACVQPSVTPGFLVDEDCLRLNVYTPGYRSPGLPVIVYMHPGGFYSGTGRSDVSGPLYLLEKNLVLVTINYRLGSLGYLSTGDKWAPGNYGFKDQVSAFRWVQRNIRAFGGDPTRVTLAGYSAGSLSIGLHMVSPMSKGLFHGAIMSSASPISQVVIGPHQRHLAVRQGQLLGCNETRSKELVDCLKTKPWRAFADTLDGMFEFGFDPVLLWNAVLEPACCGPRFLEEQPLAVIESGRMYAVPTLIGQTRDEFFWKAFNILNNATLFTAMKRHWSSVAPIAFMLPAGGSGQEPTDNQTQGTGGIVPAVSAARTLRHAYIGSGKLRNNSRTADALGKLYSDAIIGFEVHRMTRLLARYSPRPVHAYEFAYIGERSFYEDPNTMRPVGVAHHDDLLYLFSIRAGFPDVVPGTIDDRIVETYISIWYQMASTGDPTPPNVYWPVFTPSKRQYLRISDNLTVHQNLFEDRYNVWDELYPVQY